MSVAIAQVKQIIEISAVDSASRVVGKAQGSLKGLEAQAARTGAASSAMGATSVAALKGIQEKAGHTESALKGIKDFAGTIAPQVSGIGDAFGVVEAVMRLLPGPAGLVATAVVAAAAGAYALTSHLNKVAAQARLLVSAEGGRLAKSLGLDTEAAAKLSGALADLGKDGIAPTDALLREVAANARALGQEPAEAVAKFIAAWKEGPEAVAKVQREIGKLSVQVQEVPALARAIGLDPKALGLEATLTATDRLKAGLVDMAKLKASAVAADKESQELYVKAASATATQSLALREQAAAQQAVAAELWGQIASEELATRFRVKKVEAEKSFADVSKTVSEITAAANVAADLALDKQAAQRARVKGIADAQEAVQKEIARQQDLVARGTGKEAADRVKSLEAQVLQLAAQRKAIDTAAAADRQAKAREASDRAKAADAAALDAALRLRRAQIDADGLQTMRERLDLLDAEVARERRAVQVSGVGAKTRAVQLAAIDQEAANKRRVLAEQEAAATRKGWAEIVREAEDDRARRVSIAAQAADARIATERGASASIAARLRELGQADQAVLVERRQAHADYAAEVARIDRETVAAQRNVNDASQEFADLEVIREQRKLAAKQSLADQERRLDAERDQRLRDGIAMAAESIRGPAELVGRLGEANAGLSAGLSTAATGIANVARNWKGLGASAPDAIGAVGAVASAFVDGERSKAGIAAVTETAAALASAAVGDFVGAAGHGAAAALYAGIAGGAIGTPSTAPTASAGGFSAPSGGIATPAKGQGGGAVVINFNQPLVTKQEVGKAVAGALRSIGPSGLAKAKGV